MRRWPWSLALELAFFLAAIGLAIALRISLLPFKSIDFFNYTKVWYNALKDAGFSAFAQSFSNYNLPYLYLLYGVVRLAPDLPAVVATKVPSLASDFIAAFYAYRIVLLRYKRSPFPALAGFAILFAPTVVLNSAFWGQADAVYGCALLAALYYTLRRKHWPAMLLFGTAMALKAQAVFLLPVVFALMVRREIPWRYALLIPAVMLAALVPALIAGRPLLDLLLIYPAQAGQYQQLTMHAPSALAWIPDTGRFYPYFFPASIVLAIAGTMAFIVGIVRSPSRLTNSRLLQLALISTMLLPFLLPKMHERYFYLADLLSIVIAFYEADLYFVPVAMISISFFAYQPTLFGSEPVPMGILATGILGLLVILGRHAVSELYPAAAHGEGATHAVE
jgi:Gpi18-like mannosyltransferase